MAIIWRRWQTWSRPKCGGRIPRVREWCVRVCVCVELLCEAFVLRRAPRRRWRHRAGRRGGEISDYQFPPKSSLHRHVHDDQACRMALTLLLASSSLSLRCFLRSRFVAHRWPCPCMTSTTRQGHWILSRVVLGVKSFYKQRFPSSSSQ